MSRVASLAVVLGVLLAGAAVALPTPDVELETYIPHPPIRIVGDEGPEGIVLAWQDGTPVYRPGSGVTAGTGTPDDPFILRGWRVQGVFGAVDEAISVEGTRAHLRIEGNLISSSAVGLLVRDAQNVAIVANDVRGNAIAGAWIVESDGVIIEGNTFSTTLYDFFQTEGAGLWIQRSDGARIVGNAVLSNEFMGVRIEDARDTLVAENVFERNGGSVRIESSHGTIVTRNDFRNTETNQESHVYLVRQWTAAGPLPDPSGTLVTRNTFTSANAAVSVRESTSLVVEDNDVSSVKYGVVNSAPGTVVSRNNVQAWIGLDAFGHEVDARGNWWGCPEGPGADGCSPIVSWGGASVAYDPWLSSPNPAAGEAAADATALPAPPSRTPHPPILIEEDVGPAGFILARDPVTSAPIYRPGSGVVAGSGFPWDPYVIRGWDIVPAPGLDVPNAAIHIGGTSAFVVIEDVYAHDMPYGISLHSARNVVVRDNDILNVWRGVAMSDSARVSVLDNDIDTPDPYSWITGTYGVGAFESSDVLVDGNTMRHTMSGVLLRGTARATITNNDMSYDHEFGIEGVYAWGQSSDLTIAHNSIRDFHTGVDLDGVSRALVEANDLQGISFTTFSVGAGGGPLEGVTFRGNNAEHAFTNTHRSAFNDAQTSPVDMRDNWWGCTGGPGAAGCGPIIDDTGAIDASTWLAAPNPLAGPLGGGA